MKKKLTELKIRTHVWIHTGLLVAGGLVSVLGAKLGERGTALPVFRLGLGMVIAGILWRVFFVKCPHCGSGLYSVQSFPEYCPGCGEKLDECNPFRQIATPVCALVRNDIKNGGLTHEQHYLHRGAHSLRKNGFGCRAGSGTER